MCVVSMVGDFYRDTWEPKPWYPGTAPINPQTPAPHMPTSPPPAIVIGDITRAEFEELKRQVLEMKELLTRAKAYDEANGERDCEIDEKMDLLRRVAAAVGVDLDDVLKKKG